jgi:hypothetical protein
MERFFFCVDPEIQGTRYRSILVIESGSRDAKGIKASIENNVIGNFKHMEDSDVESLVDIIKSAKCERYVMDVIFSPNLKAKNILIPYN